MLSNCYEAKRGPRVEAKTERGGEGETGGEGKTVEASQWVFP
jgi:hypothetical protein